MEELIFIGQRTGKTQHLNKDKGDFSAFDCWLNQDSKKVSIFETDKRGAFSGNKRTL